MYYFQIAKCFRDEDLRADRQPEFTQLDVEMAFVEEESVMQLCEELFNEIFKKLLDVKTDLEFKKIRFFDAIEKFGCDKPDLRNPLTLCEIKEIVKKVEFKVFSDCANDDQTRIAALKVTNGCSLTEIKRKK